MVAKKGRQVCFHGAFGSKSKAEDKEDEIRRRARNRRGCEARPFIRRTRIRGDTRFLVLTERTKKRR